MTDPYHIVDNKLPITQSYKVLKEEGLAFIQKFSSDTWTNFNPSDPGVTILEQVCFALTELGYCNSFSIQDILTRPDGKLQIENQFYAPEELLTTSPVNNNDYIKYIIDGIAEVNNVVIIPVKTSFSIVNGVYKVYLLINKHITDENEKKKICESVFFLLNKSRNLGELFLMPKPLQPIKYIVSGVLEIDKAYDHHKVLVCIQQRINEYIFPKVIQTGYDTLKEDRVTTNEIFNGPQLQNGWIPTASIKEKRDHIQATEITRLIRSVEGVKSITQLGFGSKVHPIREVSSLKSEILVLDIMQSLAQDDGLQIQYNGRLVNHTIQSDYIAKISNIPEISTQIESVTSIQISPELPKGNYRDINSYYSIQNTFPEIFAVGADATYANASSFKIAQSRQLKGYLTLFDQVLANQFSQLANVSTLFSFKNSLSGDPSDEKIFYKTKNAFEKNHLKYPVPFLSFSPTYFYQSLYDTVPHIQPLLKNNEAFTFGPEIESKKKLDNDSWKDYQNDPYNSYIHGLEVFMEDDEVNLTRRNKLLNHLLARHGESPMIIDEIIEGTVYSGNENKDRVILKSLLLQNLGLLSYYRQKAYNFIGAQKVDLNVKRTPVNSSQRLLEGYNTDFIFNTDQVDAQERIQQQDFINYAAVELKLNLLFGLEIQYQDYLVKVGTNEKFKKESNQCVWMIQERKGFIFLETNLLIQSADFEIVITEDSLNGGFWYINESLSYTEMISIEQWFQDHTMVSLSNLVQNDALQIEDTTYRLVKKEDSNWDKKWFKSINGSKNKLAIKVKWGNQLETSLGDPIFNNTVVCIFPDFISQFATVAFQNRVRFFLENELPVQVTSRCYFINSIMLERLIPEFVNWHNNLIYQSEEHLHGTGLVESAGILAATLLEINLLNND